jgi:hypothetical protein
MYFSHFRGEMLRLRAVLARLYRGRNQYRLGSTKDEFSTGWALQRQRST